MQLPFPSEELLPEPVGCASTSTARPKTKPPKQDVPFTQWLGGAFVSVPLVLLHLLVGTLIWQQLLEGDPSFYDAWYFTVVTFTTVGYGDVLPVSGNAKLFFMGWCVLSSCIQFTVVARFLGTVLAFTPDPDADLQRDHRGRPLTHAANKFFQIRPRLVAVGKWVALLVVLLIVGTYLIRESYEESQGETLDWLDCWYWSFTTLTTVGYGDFVPQHQKVLFSLFFLVNVTIFGFVLSEVSGIVVDLDRYYRLERLFADGLTRQLMDVMDTDCDGAISKVEFVAYVLDHLGIADMGEMEAIGMMFDALDGDGNGMLYMADTKERMRAMQEDKKPPVATSVASRFRAAAEVGLGGRAWVDRKSSPEWWFRLQKAVRDHEGGAVVDGATEPLLSGEV